MINSPHMQPQLMDYALGLLSPEDRKTVEAHTAVCPPCQAALQEEMQLGQLMKTTLQTATHVENGRLRQLMPTIPQKTRVGWAVARPWQRQLASVCVLAMLLFGGMGFYQANFGPSHGIIAPTSLAITATNTAAPTETAVSYHQYNSQPTSTAVVSDTITEEQPIAPRAAATPIAFVNATN